MNRQQYMRSLIEQGLSPSQIADKMREFDNQTSGGQGIEFENPQSEPDVVQQHASEFTQEDFDQLLMWMVDGKYEKVLYKAIRYTEDDDTKKEPVP